MATTDDVPRLFLQAALSRRVMSKELAHTLWKKSIEVVQECSEDQQALPTSDNNWVDFLKNLNDSLNDLDMEFRNFRDEEEGREWFGIVNRKGDVVAQSATSYNPAEIAYFKALIAQIMLAPRKAYSISSSAAYKEVNFVKGLTKLQAEDVLDNFVANRWLHRSKRGRYSLSARTILELESYLKTEFPDEITHCIGCRELLTKGFACTTEGCKGRTHAHCLKTARGKCPACQGEWPKTAKDAGNVLIPIGEGAVRDGQEFQRVVRNEEPDAEGDADMADASQTTEPSQPKKKGKAPQRKGNGKGKGKGKAKAAEDSDASMSEHSEFE